MKRGKVSRDFWVTCKRRARLFVSVILAGMLLWNGSGIAQATTLADIFDARQYADRYSDLKEAFGYDEKALLEHYLTYGIAEGRDGFGLLEVRKYREKYPDLDAAFGDNWDAYVDHYLTYGIKEHRDPGTDFDPLAYMERYEDLKEAFGDDALALYQHYMIFGKSEGRDAKKEAPVQNRGGANGGQSGNIVKDPNRQPIYGDDGSITGYYSNEYDEQGNVRKQTYYRLDGSISDCSEYDENGFETKWTLYNEDGSVYSYTLYKVVETSDGSRYIRRTGTYYADGGHRVYEYTDAGKMAREIYYDPNGVMSSCTEFDENEEECKYTRYNEDGSVSYYSLVEEIQTGPYSSYIRDTATYNADGSFIIYEYTSETHPNERNEKRYNADGTLWLFVENEYDEQGNQLIERQYNAEGTLQLVKKYEYDEQGKQVKWIEYDAEGNMLGYYQEEADGHWHYYPAQ